MSGVAPAIETFDPRPRLAALLRRELPGERVAVLEAGCGTFEHLDLPAHWRLTGLDISPEALALNERVDEKLVGDVQSLALPPRHDLVICWDVLEHLPDPAAAVRNLAGALRPGGLLLLAIPLRSGFKGFMTRLLPYPLHVAYYRHVMRWPQAGEPGHRPFPTPMRAVLEPDALHALLARAGTEPLWAERYASEHYRDILYRYGAVSWLTRLAAALVGALSLGRIDRRRSDYVGVHRKCGAPGAPPAGGAP